MTLATNATSGNSLATMTAKAYSGGLTKSNLVLSSHFKINRSLRQLTQRP